jgi:hypothetical protein
LFLHHVVDGGGHRGVELCGARAAVCLFGQQQFDHVGGARQAAGVGSKNSVRAAFHGAFLPISSAAYRAVWFLVV